MALTSKFFEPICCANCNVEFGIGALHQKKLIESGKPFHYPNGHENTYERAK